MELSALWPGNLVADEEGGGKVSGKFCGRGGFWYPNWYPVVENSASGEVNV